jgi:hypothetical protein
MQRFCALLVVAAALLVNACASRNQPTAEPPVPQAVGPITAEKWFVIAVRSTIGVCRVDVHPKKPKNDGDTRVHVKQGTTAAWIAGNTCSEDKDIQLKDFIHEDEPGTKRPASDVFESIDATAYTWTGKVRADARKGKWKYTVVVGSKDEDPEIIIF